MKRKKSKSKKSKVVSADDSLWETCKTINKSCDECKYKKYCKNKKKELFDSLLCEDNKPCYTIKNNDDIELEDLIKEL